MSKLFELESLSSRLAQFRNCALTFVNNQFIDKHNAEIELSRQTLTKYQMDNE